MDKCYLCGKKIEKNKTKQEHIIPNAVGGKLTSKSILCSDCNNNLSDIKKFFVPLNNQVTIMC